MTDSVQVEVVRHSTPTGEVVQGPAFDLLPSFVANRVELASPSSPSRTGNTAAADFLFPEGASDVELNVSAEDREEARKVRREKREQKQEVREHHREDRTAAMKALALAAVGRKSSTCSRQHLDKNCS